MYSYETEKQFVFTEDGQVMFLAIRDKANRLFDMAGAARLDKMIERCGGGSSWSMLACVDRLVEMGEIQEVSNGGAAQRRVFVRRGE